MKKEELKRIIPIGILFMVGIGTHAGAATIFNSKDITYNNSNVKSALDELYKKSRTIAEQVELGDYIRMTPISTNYAISKSLTNYTENQELNPSELNLWRVIKKNDDGTIDMVSEYISSNGIRFYGQLGYMNYVGTLNEMSKQYMNDKFTISARSIEGNKKIDFCTSLDCNGEYNLNINDMSLIYNALNSTSSKPIDGGEETRYYISLRAVQKDKDNDERTIYILGHGCDQTSYAPHGVSGTHAYYTDTGDRQNPLSLKFRPIVTLKSNIVVKSGDGKSASTAYILEGDDNVYE